MKRDKCIISGCRNSTYTAKMCEKHYRAAFKENRKIFSRRKFGKVTKK